MVAACFTRADARQAPTCRENDHVNLEGWLVRQDLFNNPTQSAICRLALALQTPTGQPRDECIIETTIAV